MEPKARIAHRRVPIQGLLLNWRGWGGHGPAGGKEGSGGK